MFELIYVNTGEIIINGEIFLLTELKLLFII